MERDVLVRELTGVLGPHPSFEFGIETMLDALERLGYTIVRAPKSPSRAMNPPIRGHELIAEGRNWTESGVVIGGCRCGAQPDGCGHLAINAVKRWHREHKAELRGGF